MIRLHTIYYWSPSSAQFVHYAQRIMCCCFPMFGFGPITSYVLTQQSCIKHHTRPSFLLNIAIFSPFKKVKIWPKCGLIKSSCFAEFIAGYSSHPTSVCRSIAFNREAGHSRSLYQMKDLPLQITQYFVFFKLVKIWASCDYMKWRLRQRDLSMTKRPYMRGNPHVLVANCRVEWLKP